VDEAATVELVRTGPPMIGDCPYIVIVRCSQRELDDINRARRANEQPGDVLRRRLGMQPEYDLADTRPERISDRRHVVGQPRRLSRQP
jgi:hypothetical protein